MKKKYFIFLLFITASCFAQQKERITAFDKIMLQEKNAYTKWMDAKFQSAASTNFDISFYRCEWAIDPAVRFIAGKVTAYFAVTATTNSIVFDLNNSLVVDSIFFRGTKLAFIHGTDHALTIQLGSTLPIGTKDSIAIYYQGVPSNNGTGSFANSTHNGVPVMWTLSEPYGASDWWPCKNGLNDKADSLDVIITTDSLFRGVSNGVQVADILVNDKRIVHFKHRHPIATYLIGIAATDYKMYKDSVALTNRTVPIVSYTFPEYYAVFETEEIYTKQALQLYSSLFGDYPFANEKYGHTQFNAGGGIEHQTNSFIRWPWNYLIVHELAHQWFGDKITCASWKDIWLNEGFATYLSIIYFENLFPSDYPGILAQNHKVVVSKPDGSVYVNDTTSTSSIFNARLSYNKGAYVLHMLRWKLGDSIFFKGMRAYLNDPALQFGFATTKDFKRNMEQVAGISLESFFNNWIYGQGFPSYQLTWQQNNSNWVKLNLSQTTAHPSVSFFDMPVAISLKGISTDTTIVLNHRFNGQELWVNAGFKVDTVLIDKNLWLLSANDTTIKISSASLIRDDIQVFPNPAPEQLTIQWQNPSSKKFTIQLLNTAGQLVLLKQVETPGQDETYTIPIQHLPRGIYWVKLINDAGIQNVREIVH